MSCPLVDTISSIKGIKDTVSPHRAWHPWLEGSPSCSVPSGLYGRVPSAPPSRVLMGRSCLTLLSPCLSESGCPFVDSPPPSRPHESWHFHFQTPLLLNPSHCPHCLSLRPACLVAGSLIPLPPSDPQALLRSPSLRHGAELLEAQMQSHPWLWPPWWPPSPSSWATVPVP